MTISLPASTTATHGSTVTIPVTLTNPSNNAFVDYSFAVLLDPTVLQPANPAISTAGTLSSTMTAVSDANTAGRLGVSAATGDPLGINGAGTLINLKFTVVGTAPNTTTLNFSNVLFEDTVGNPITTTPVNGGFTVMVSTAAGVTISGRVLTSNGAGLRNAHVTLTDMAGNVHTVITSAFGYYMFENVTSGETYLVGVGSRNHSYPTRVVQVFDTLTNVDFTPQ